MKPTLKRMKERQHPIEGHGPPPKTMEAPVGTRYFDLDSGERWRMTGNGWSNITFLHLRPRIRQKNLWLDAARLAGGLKIEDWIFRVLDREAKR